MHTRTRRASRGTAALAVAAALAFGSGQAVTAGTVNAATGTADPAPGATSPSQAQGPKAGQQQDQRWVTLITGDRVLVQSGRRGGGSIVPGPGRRKISFATLSAGGHDYVIPSDAARLVQRGVLDRRLFDVTTLMKFGYDDTTRKSLPLLVTYTDGVPAATRSKAPAGAKLVRTLPTIGGAALRAEKATVAGFWSGLTKQTRAKSPQLKKVWLDGKVKASLDRSVPQIGAPKAWQAGYTGKGVKIAIIDTGVDETHPDLAGRQVAEKNFSDSADAVDRQGHGTHVASTATGTGAKTGGKYKGVAPQAGYLDAKVLSDEGWGMDSGIIAGMEWAAQQGADVANVSLGGDDIPGVDPLEEAVNNLSAKYGILFVAAAGNAGPGKATLGTPGTAVAALTVGAVDRDDSIADFSSRGPVKDEAIVKPDITAPGVGIVAALSSRATDLEPTVAGYTGMSGTSMATPHVAGAAALLAQQYPTATGNRLKQLLMASAKPAKGAGAYAQGAGRVDSAKVLSQKLTAEPPSLGFPLQQWPHDDDLPVAKQLTLANAGPGAVTLDLRIETTGPNGKPSPAGVFTVSAPKVTIPAGGKAKVTVTANTRSASADGVYSGALIATGGGVSLRAPLVVDREVESYDLTLRTTDRSGALTDAYDNFLVDVASGELLLPYEEDGSVTVRVPKGKYMMGSFVDSGSEANATFDFIAYPDLTIDGDLTVNLDARKVKPMRIGAPDPAAEVQFGSITFARTVPGGPSLGAFQFPDGDLSRTGTLHLGPTLPKGELTALTSVQWLNKASAKRYALAWAQHGKFFTGLTRDGTKEKLATVRTSYDRGNAKETIQVVAIPMANHEQVSGRWIMDEMPNTGQYTAYFNTKGIDWQTAVLLPSPKNKGRVQYVSPPRTYQAGKTYAESYGRPVLGPVLPADRFPYSWVTREGDGILVDLPGVGDAAGNAGNTDADDSSIRLWRNGVEMAGDCFGRFCLFEAAPGAAEYKLTDELDRSSMFDLSTKLSTTWTFRSDTTGRVTRLPISTVRFFPKVTKAGFAPAGRSFVVPVAVQEQGSSRTKVPYKLTAEVSYDGGDTWQPATIQNRSQLVLQHPADPDATVSLRAKATDGNGNTVDQTIIDAYRLH